MFYDEFIDLCKAKRVTRTKACIDCGISRTAWHKWEGGSTPNGDTLNKIADYFRVSVSYLLGDKKEKKPPTENREELLRFALWNGDKGITQAQIDEVKRFAEFVKERDKKNGK